jgi:hypothetical protein
MTILLSINVECSNQRRSRTPSRKTLHNKSSKGPSGRAQSQFSQPQPQIVQPQPQRVQPQPQIVQPQPQAPAVETQVLENAFITFSNSVKNIIPKIKIFQKHNNESGKEILKARETRDNFRGINKVVAAILRYCYAILFLPV